MRPFVFLSVFASLREITSALVFFACASSAVLAAETPDYGKQIAPIFNKYCTACHNPDDLEGKLSLASYDELLKGGKRGLAISAGHSDQSLLIRMLTGEAKPVMPPEDNERPKPEEIELLKKWIDAGAKGPEGRRADPTILVTPKIAPKGSVRRAITAIAFSPKGDTIAVGRHASRGDHRRRHAASYGTRSRAHGQRQRSRVHADGAQLIAVAGEPGLFGEVRAVEHSRRPAGASVARAQRQHLFPGRGQRRQNDRHRQLRPEDQALGPGIRQRAAHARRAQRRHLRSCVSVATPSCWQAPAATAPIKLWEVEDGERLDTFSQPIGDQYAAAFSPDGRFVAAAGGDNRVRLWRLSDTAAEGTNELLYSRFAHEQPIVALAWSSDGKTIATSGEDRRVKLWHAGDVTERLVVEPQPDVADALAFSADSKRLAAGRLDGSLAVYNADDGKPIAPVPPAKPELASIEPAGVRPAQTAPLDD